MAYTQLTTSPANIALARSLGATGLHVGILEALPTAMLFMQFVAAVFVNTLSYRRRLWIGVSIAQRLILLPAALGIALVPELSDHTWLWILIAAATLNHGLLHFGTPLWMSWMGDYLPRPGLSQFWGVRHFWMQWTAALSLLAGACLMLGSGWSIRHAFAALIAVAAVAGLADVLAYLKVDEPPVTPLPAASLRQVLSDPFRNAAFRTFIAYSCFWNFACMVGAPFISLFLLQYVGMSVGSVLLVWALSWVGGAVFSGSMGRLAERYGHRPLLVLCTIFKPLNMLVLLILPQNPTLAFWLVTPAFMLDALLNAGIAIATNGFLLKNSPRQNRSMFIAAGTALAGIVGGVTAIAAGLALTGLTHWSLPWGPIQITAFHVMFAISFLLRVVSIQWVRRIREPASTEVREVLVQLVGATPFRSLRFPVGLYRAEERVPEPVLEEELPRRQSRAA
jgi:MFS family permease